MPTFYQLPRDPVMLLSFVNTQLRDRYSSLEDFASAYQVDQDSVVNTLQTIDYVYDRGQNQFI